MRLFARIAVAASVVVGGVGALEPLTCASAAVVVRAPEMASPAAAVVAEINSVRAQFGLAPGVLTHLFDASVSAAALGEADPRLPRPGARTTDEYGVWGLAPSSPPISEATTSSVINAWIYDDGWNGADTWNLDCSGPTAPGCNSHRDAVLSTSRLRRARLSIDVSSVSTTYEGVPSVSLAVLLIWTHR